MVRVWAGMRPGRYMKERPRYTGDSRLLPGLCRDLVSREVAAVLLTRVLRAALAHLSARMLPAFAHVIPVEANL